MPARVAVKSHAVGCEIATWSGLAEPATIERLTKLVEALHREPGWARVDGEQGVVVEPAKGVKQATLGCMGRQVAHGAVSHGCIRMRDRDIKRLGRLMPVDTSLTIS